MGLAQVQRLLAELYTDPALRERFFAEPQQVGAPYGLTADETHQLGQLPAKQVSFFASSLRRKRLNDVARLLPLTRRALGKTFARLFWRYADTFIPQGVKKQRQDALAFSSFVQRIARVQPVEPPRAVELLRYEAAWVRAAAPGACLIVRRFQEPISSLLRGAEPGKEREEHARSIPTQPTIAFWFRPAPGSRLRHPVLSLPRLRRGV